MNYTVLKKFTFNGVTYEIRGWVKCGNQAGTIFIKAVNADTGKDANGYEYSVSMQTYTDAKLMKAAIDPFKSLIETAENDVKNGTWESYLKALQELSIND